MKRPSIRPAALLLGLTLAACGKPVSGDTPTGAAPGYDTGAPPPSAEAPEPAALYRVVDGNKVDAATLEGFRTWREATCDRCHGAEQQGQVGPSLIEGMKKLSKEEFVKIVLEGRLDKGMPGHKDHPRVSASIDKLYAYLKGRSDGAITQAKVQAIQ